MIPGVVVAFGARAGEGEIRQVQRLLVTIDFSVRQAAPGKRLRGASRQRVGKRLGRHPPAIGARLAIETRDVAHLS